MGRRRPVKNCSADGIRLPRLPLLTDEEVRELKQRIRAGCEDARDELVSRNLRLVMSLVNKFPCEPGEKEDLFQVGCVGLLKAADRFDESCGTRFSTYTVPVILGPSGSTSAKEEGSKSEGHFRKKRSRFKRR